MRCVRSLLHSIGHARERGKSPTNAIVCRTKQTRARVTGLRPDSQSLFLPQENFQSRYVPLRAALFRNRRRREIARGNATIADIFLRISRVTNEPTKEDGDARSIDRVFRASDALGRRRPSGRTILLSRAG